MHACIHACTKKVPSTVLSGGALVAYARFGGLAFGLPFLQRSETSLREVAGLQEQTEAPPRA